MKVAVTIPTYNEKDNISTLLERVFAQGNLTYDIQAVVVDDNSPDGTGALLDDLKAKRYGDKLHIVHRLHEKGRGTAGIAGFKYARGLDVDCIMEMDADLSHNPKYIPVFLDFMKYYDIAIGSRYVEGGAVAGWSFFRLLNSSVANFIYHVVLGTKLRDLSGGFKCYRKKVIQSLDFDNFFSTGYAIGIETLFRCHRKGFTMVEFPVVFHNRKKGASKFALKEAVQALYVVFRLLLELGRAVPFHETRGKGLLANDR